MKRYKRSRKAKPAPTERELKSRFGDDTLKERANAIVKEAKEPWQKQLKLCQLKKLTHLSKYKV